MKSIPASNGRDGESRAPRGEQTQKGEPRGEPRPNEILTKKAKMPKSILMNLEPKSEFAVLVHVW
jgi:hypothetical protein